MSNLALVLALGTNGQLGLNGGLPWPHMKADMQFFKTQTMGHAVIMGRKTWESLPEKARPLPDRHNIVITRNRQFMPVGGIVAYDFDHALVIARSLDASPCVIGGAEVYKAALPHAGFIKLSEVDYDGPADVRFECDWSEWREISRQRVSTEKRLQHVFLVRKNLEL